MLSPCSRCRRHVRVGVECPFCARRATASGVGALAVASLLLACEKNVEQPSAPYEPAASSFGDAHPAPVEVPAVETPAPDPSAAASGEKWPAASEDAAEPRPDAQPAPPVSSDPENGRARPKYGLPRPRPKYGMPALDDSKG